MADLNKALETQIKNIEESTGKKRAEWIKIINTMGDLKHGRKSVPSRRSMALGMATPIPLSISPKMTPDSARANQMVTT
jgi:hypothetical protein